MWSDTLLARSISCCGTGWALAIARSSDVRIVRSDGSRRFMGGKLMAPPEMAALWLTTGESAGRWWSSGDRLKKMRRLTDSVRVRRGGICDGAARAVLSTPEETDEEREGNGAKGVSSGSSP